MPKVRKGAQVRGQQWAYLQVWPLVVNYKCQQLVLQALFCHTEVHQRRLRSYLGLVVRVGQLGLHSRMSRAL